MKDSHVTFGRVFGVAIIAGCGALLWHHGLEDDHVRYIFAGAGVGILIAASKEVAGGISSVGSAVQNSPLAAYIPKRLSQQVKPPTESDPGPKP